MIRRLFTRPPSIISFFVLLRTRKWFWQNYIAFRWNSHHGRRFNYNHCVSIHEIYEWNRDHSNIDINSSHSRDPESTFVQTSEKQDRSLFNRPISPASVNVPTVIYIREIVPRSIPVQKRDVLLRARRRHNATTRCTRPSRWIYRAAWK